jgi:metallophosphoesterase (TIGR03767 family)
MGSTPSGPTVSGTLGPGATVGQRTEGAYRRLAVGPGERHLQRLELIEGRKPPATVHRTSLLHFATITDVHILETASPGRFEFAQRLYGHRAPHILAPVYRPQEPLQLHACEAMIRTINALPGSPRTGAPLDFVLCTGDLTDNVQRNELQNVMRLLEGGARLRPWNGNARDEGVESDSWDDSGYWHPSALADEYKTRWGFPSYTGLLEEAFRGFDAAGIALPWISCYGNHDALVVGTALPTPAYERIVTGSEKPRQFAPGFDPVAHLGSFIPRPELFLTGPTVAVALDPDRRAFSRQEFVRAHLDARGEPVGHGFSPENVSRGTAYYVDDRHPGFRIIVLDTVNVAGNFPGSLGARQLAWLEESLIEAHSRYVDESGRTAQTGNEDRLVIIASHHGIGSLTNDLTDPERDDDLPRALGPAVEALLHRFPNIILWVNGHTHYNTVQPRIHPSTGSGFWEVTTASLIDWPCQGRLVEIIDNDDGTLSIVCTMIDHGAPAEPEAADGLWRLAAIHRELAANDPHAGVSAETAGRPADRNVELVIPTPFGVGWR